MGSGFGRFFTVQTFGESHGPGLGVVVDGAPAGIELSREDIQADLDRRRPGTSSYTSSRAETDHVEILSGVAEGRTLGTPIAMLIRNRDARSKDYKSISDRFRPGHADYTYFKKYGLAPQPGGGRASGRETAGRVAAGAVARAMLKGHCVKIMAYTVRLGGLEARLIDPDFAAEHVLRFADPDLAARAEALLRTAMDDHDSLGGVVEVVAQGLPSGLGDPVFEKLDARLGMALLSIGAVKGVEFGAGFNLADMRGSEANDQIRRDGFTTNMAGGVLGGISTGQDLLVRLAVKPTPSIARVQKTIDLEENEVDIEIKGRHDPCICPRICPVAEAMTAIVLADAVMEQAARKRSVW